MNGAGRRSFTAAKWLNPDTPGSRIKRLCGKFASLVATMGRRLHAVV